MDLNEIGKIAGTEWLKTFEMRPDMNLIMGEYVIMPNHFHAVIIIGENQYNSRRNPPPDNPAPHSKNQFGPQSKNLASIIRGFKIGVTTRARTVNSNFAWQPRFHDHIIWDDRSFTNISNYIKKNPSNWQKDKFG